jgi:hypothetical protein
MPMRIFDANVLLDISRDYDDHRTRRISAYHGYAEGDGWGAIPFVSALLGVWCVPAAANGTPAKRLETRQ